MTALLKHSDLVAELDKRQHEKISDTVRRFHHGANPNGARDLHEMLWSIGYYPAGSDQTIKDAWAAFRFSRKDRPVHQIGIHRKTDPDNPEVHFTDIVLY